MAPGKPVSRCSENIWKLRVFHRQGTAVGFPLTGSHEFDVGRVQGICGVTQGGRDFNIVWSNHPLSA